MDFIDQIKGLSERVIRLKDQITTEEATKNAFIMPFINILGYDVFNPLEVIPEYVADLGIKKGEKVDYCIQKDGKPIIIVECKWWGEKLDVHNSQLHRYFHVSKARFAILSNGIVFRFYTDLDEINKMDDKPFFEFSLTDLKENVIGELKKFHKSAFNVEDILNTASELKYATEIRNVLSAQLTNPSEEFVKFFAGNVYKGLKTAKVIEQFTPIVKKSLNQFISDLISDRLKTALNNETRSLNDYPEPSPTVETSEDVKTSKVETTELEMEAYLIVKSLLRTDVRSTRIGYRDNQTYLTVLLDDNIRKQVCRLYLNNANKYIAFVEEGGKEIKNKIEALEDIYNFAEQLKRYALKFEEKMIK